MKIKLLSVGKVRNEFIRQGEIEYIKRIQKFNPLQIDYIKEERIIKSRKPSEIITAEGERLLKKIPPRSWVVAMDKNGTLFSSERFAQLISGVMNKGTAYLLFIIGGTLGLSNTVKDKSHAVISLSKMTFTHEMTRLILLEQIYRSFTILKGKKYHK
ncbi:MAG: 23S rRNA (pseudouridine(1915)-N(3))-methyltransferase RlmH [bacterium]